VSRIVDAGLAALGVVVAVTVGYVLTHNDDAPASGSPTPPSVASRITEVPSPSEVPGSVAGSVPGSDATKAPGSGSASAEQPVVVAWLGDDWTAGAGASKQRKRFTTVVSRRLDVTELNFGADGTGYAQSSADGTAYRGRLADVVAAHPDVVVVSGGRNDVLNDPDTAATRARKLFAQLHRELPDAQLVAIRPFWGDSDPPAALDTLANSIRQAVTDVGGTYLDIADPIHGHPEYMADDADPDDDGYAAIASALREPIAGVVATS
jgi:lysophospholipase L1-like esterase